MVYGKADFMGIPWEIIVKQYRAKLGPLVFSSLREYAEDFWKGHDNLIEVKYA